MDGWFFKTEKGNWGTGRKARVMPILWMKGMAWEDESRTKDQTWKINFIFKATLSFNCIPFWASFQRKEGNIQVGENTGTKLKKNLWNVWRKTLIPEQEHAQGVQPLSHLCYTPPYLQGSSISGSYGATLFFPSHKLVCLTSIYPKRQLGKCSFKEI